MRTLIFGAKGQLGRELMAVFRDTGEVAGHDLPEVNINNEATLHPLFEAFRPELVINAAAYTDVDGAEDDLETAFLVNEAGARNVADLAAYYDAPIVYYSTDYVFDGGKRAPYTTEDPICPVSVYGKSKAAGEVATRKANPHHFVVRTAWLYGPGGNHFIRKILDAAKKRDSLKVVSDEVGSPTYTRDLAEATRALAQTRAYGIYHAANDGSCSRYEQACEAMRLAGIDTPVAPCSSAEFPTKACRPAYSALDASKLAQVTGQRMRPWNEALADYIQRTAGERT